MNSTNTIQSAPACPTLVLFDESSLGLALMIVQAIGMTSIQLNTDQRERHE
jgi:ABC-type branched-subunit amino acid transport system ATPase component